MEAPKHWLTQFAEAGSMPVLINQLWQVLLLWERAVPEYPINSSVNNKQSDKRKRQRHEKGVELFWVGKLSKLSSSTR